MWITLEQASNLIYGTPAKRERTRSLLQAGRLGEKKGGRSGGKLEQVLVERKSVLDYIKREKARAGSLLGRTKARPDEAREVDPVGLAGWKTVREMAAERECTVAAIYNQIRTGKLEKRTVQGLIFVR